MKDADKLTRYGKGFLFLTRALSIAPDDLAGGLEEMIEKWFFFPESREMAKAALGRHSALRTTPVAPSGELS